MDLCQKSSESFSIFFFIEEYQFRSTFFVIEIFWYDIFLNHGGGSAYVIYGWSQRLSSENNLQVEVNPPKRQKNDENIKILENRVEKLEKDVQSVNKVWRNRLIIRILQISTNEDTESLTKLGPDELLSKYEEVMVKLV